MQHYTLHNRLVPPTPSCQLEAWVSKEYDGKNIMSYKLSETVQYLPTKILRRPSIVVINETDLSNSSAFVFCQRNCCIPL